MKFTHLHTHTHYSLLDGLTRIDELMIRVKELGMDSVAITDHGVMYGVIEFYQKAKKAGIKPIIGCEAYTAENMYDKRPGADGERYYHLVLLAENNTGYHNLIKIVTAAHLEGFYYRPRVDKNFLRQHAKGLIGMSACLGGEIPRALLAGQNEKASRLAREYESIFGKGNFFLEIQHHPNLEDQNRVTPQIIALSKETGIPLVITQDSHYLRSEDANAHDVLLAVQTGNQIDDKDRLSFRGDDFSLLSPEKMSALCAETPEAIENTAAIAQRCNVEIELEKIQLPEYPLPAGQSADSHLCELAERGMKRRYGDVIPETVSTRLKYELDIIQKTGFATYFLIVQDFVNWAKSRGIIVGPGRGSVAGSLVSYATNITNVDPIKYNLLFERFLNPARVSQPDIDLDFDDARRSEVFDYVRQKYGADHFAQLITFGTMAARGSVRDAGRALGFSYDFCDKVAKLIPFNPQQGEKAGYLARCIEDVDELKQAYHTNPDVKKLIDTATQLEGIARHSSTHACGVVITPKPLTEYLPIQRDSKAGNIITQYEMHAVESLGLLKMDFLGLANLTIIEQALRLIEQNHGIKIDIDRISLDDKKTFRLLQRAETTGVFQLECLTGDTCVSNTNVEELFKKKNKSSLRSAHLDTGLLHNNKIQAVVQSGVKKVYRVVAENGRMIKASADHEFMTAQGWKKLKDLIPGVDQLMYKEKSKYVAYSSCSGCGKFTERLSENLAKHQSFCYACSARHFSNPSKPESRRAISKSRQEYIRNGGTSWNKGLDKKTSHILEETGKKISTALTGVTLEQRYGAERAEKIKQEFSKRFRGAGNPMFGKKAPHRKGGFRDDLGHYVRSNWEADFARILILHRVGYQYEPHTFTLKTEDGRILSYTPDFYTPGDNTYYEIKGWCHDLDALKMKLFEEQYPNYNFVVINTTRFAELAMRYRNMIRWECPLVPRQLSFVKIKSIAYVGEEMTYDIVMQAPGNNFIANSFVVHNSGGMKRYLKELKPTEIEDIIAMVSLYRPGPMELIPEYVARKHGKKPVEYLFPLLEPVLKNTYGIMVYQEQLIQAVRVLAGFTLAEADVLRKAVGKKIKRLLDEQEGKFKDGAVRVGTPKPIADKFWELVEPFNRYAFNRSHAACYAMLAYQTAYLKANYPVEFMAALMNSDSGDVERIAFLIEECRSMGIKVLPPAINESMERFSVVRTCLPAGMYDEAPTIRFGLAAVKNVGVNVVRAIIDERIKDGAFANIENFVTRVHNKDLNKKSFESLVKCGALDVLGERALFLANVDELMSYAREHQKTESIGQSSLFDAFASDAGSALPQLRLKEGFPLTRSAKLMWEKELLGLFISDHPLKDFETQLASQRGIISIDELIKSKKSSQAKIGGLVIKVQKIVTKTGKPMLFSWIEDVTSKIEVVVFPAVLEANANVFQENTVVVVSGKLNDRDGIPKLLCDDVQHIASLT